MFLPSKQLNLIQINVLHTRETHCFLFDITRNPISTTYEHIHARSSFIGSSDPISEATNKQQHEDATAQVPRLGNNTFQDNGRAIEPARMLTYYKSTALFVASAPGVDDAIECSTETWPRDGSSSDVTLPLYSSAPGVDEAIECSNDT
jgi:hypothetical protein